MAISASGAAPSKSRRSPLSVTSRFVLVALVVISALCFISWHAETSLTASRRLTSTLFNDIIKTQHASAEMVSAMDDVHAAALSALATRTSDPVRSRALIARLADHLTPRADANLDTVRRLHAGDDAAEKHVVADFVARWQAARAEWNAMVVDPPTESTGITRIDAAFGDVNRRARALVAREARDGEIEFSNSAKPYSDHRRDLDILLVVSLLASIAGITWLYRGVLPRTRRYSQFAQRIGDNNFEERLETRGNDELATLGRALDDMASRRQRERVYDLSQLQFAESMQLTENEAEAHRMLKRHLERSIAGSDVVILNRNNSQDRLEAVTEVIPGSPLEQSLVGAAPRSCVAVRQARTHEHGEREDTLLQCAVCSGCPGRSTCTPFLVGGEVIGSVLLSSPDRLDEEHERRIRDSVVQAAPVLANLRNLAIAETRAATDSLTGLPNRRSIDANVMRMVAHAGRSAEPIAVLLLDLDHFKQVNDRHGHAEGDEVLAAVGAAIRATIRDSDFAGRYGGEEFIVALPNTSTESALGVAELLRRAIGAIVVPSVDQAITTSIGVAAIPEHAGDASGVVRSADRALYLAKKNGRDRVESARAGDFVAEMDERRGLRSEATGANAKP